MENKKIELENFYDFKTIKIKPEKEIYNKYKESLLL